MVCRIEGLVWGGFLLRAWRFCILYGLCVILDAVWVDDASPPSTQRRDNGVPVCGDGRALVQRWSLALPLR